MRHLIKILLVTFVGPLLGQEDLGDWTGKVELINQERINTEHTEFSPSFWVDAIVFVASRPRNKIFDKNINEAFFDLYFAAGKEESKLTKTALFSKNINTPNHEGPITFSKESKKTFFTRTHLDDDNVIRNKIFESIYENGDWNKGVMSSFNSEYTASCHPSIGLLDKTMVFASDREGGFGKMDLYFSKFENGQWTEPQNLGPEVNSESNELFPFISSAGFLFYSSDQNLKKSGLDIYSCEIEKTTFKNVKRLPAPINSSYDDFGFITHPKGLTGYLSSNRPGGKGKDDLYFFESQSSVFAYNNESFNMVNCRVKDERNSVLSTCTFKYRPLSVEETRAIDPSVFSFANHKFDLAQVDNNGHANLKLNENFTLIEVTAPGKKPWYKILSGNENYNTLDIVLVDSVILKPESALDIMGEASIETINDVKVEVGAVLIFDNIYYDYNSYNIKAGAAKELDQLAQIMVSNQSMKIQLSAHTDSRGNGNYNRTLSEKRALAAKQYLINNGVSGQNIITVGYGESKLRNHCKNGIKCSESDHLYNRRTEVNVLEK